MLCFVVALADEAFFAGCNVDLTACLPGAD